MADRVQLAANRMRLVGRPKLARSLPKTLPRIAVEAMLETVAEEQNSIRQTDWADRDLAIILAALLAGLRADELRQVDIGDIRTADDNAAVVYDSFAGHPTQRQRSQPHVRTCCSTSGSGRLMLPFGEVLARVGGGLRAVMYAEFAQDGADMVVDGSLADEKGVGNVGITVTAGE